MYMRNTGRHRGRMYIITENSLLRETFSISSNFGAGRHFVVRRKAVAEAAARPVHRHVRVRRQRSLLLLHVVDGLGTEVVVVR
jgi:hypothetical protein